MSDLLKLAKKIEEKLIKSAKLEMNWDLSVNMLGHVMNYINDRKQTVLNLEVKKSLEDIVEQLNYIRGTLISLKNKNVITDSAKFKIK